MPDCPKCHSPSARKSRKPPRQPSRRIWFNTAYRCNDCGTRFYARDASLLALLAAPLVLAGVLAVGGLWAIIAPEESAPGSPGAGETEQGENAMSAESLGYGNDFVYDFEALRDRARDGDLDAQYRLALGLFEKFDSTGGVELQLEAQYWLQKAGEAGQVEAQTELGERFAAGHGVLQDFSQATSWYRRAAEQGSASAMLGLGEMARSGWSEESGPVEAYVWLNLAAARGEKRASGPRREVGSRLSPEQLSEAQQRSRDLDRSLPRYGLLEGPE
jgi:hypothetical protein